MRSMALRCLVLVRSTVVASPWLLVPGQAAFEVLTRGNAQLNDRDPVATGTDDRATSDGRRPFLTIGKLPFWRGCRNFQGEQIITALLDCFTHRRHGF